MLVLPVMQGNADFSSSGLQFWYTKSPITVMIQDEREGATKNNSAMIKLVSKKQHQLTQKHNYASTQPMDDKYDVTTENWSTNQIEELTPNPAMDSNEPSLFSESSLLHSTAVTTHRFNIPNILYPSTNNYDPQPFKLPNFVTNGKEKVSVVSAETKWKGFHRNDLLKLNKTKSDQDKSTSKPIVLPSSTRFQYYTDFQSTDSKRQPTPFQNIKLTSQVNSTEMTTQQNSLQMYDLIKHLSLKPVPVPDANNMNVLLSPDRKYFNVLAQFSIPTDGMFQDRTLSQNTLDFGNITKPWSSTESYQPLTHSEMFQNHTEPRTLTSVGIIKPWSLTELNQPTTRLEMVEDEPKLWSTFTPVDFIKPWSSTESHQPSPSRLESILTVPTNVMSTSFQNTIVPTSQSTSAFTANDKLTNDFKQMLVALGILRDNEKSITTTKKLEDLWQAEESFTIDPYSYVKFKKLPIEQENISIRQDMQTLLDSFGLLPKSKEVDYSMLTRIKRDSKFISVDKIRTSANISEILLHSKRSAVNSTDLQQSEKTLLQPRYFRWNSSSIERELQEVPVSNSLNGKKQQLNSSRKWTKNITKNQKNLYIESNFLLEGTEQQHKENKTQIERKNLGLTFSDHNVSKAKLSEKKHRTKQKRKQPNLFTFTFRKRLRSPKVSKRLKTTKITKVPKTKTKETQEKDTNIKRASNHTAPLEDLAASFGGGETASGKPTDDEPTPKSNGLYFFVDVNKFLNVEHDKNPVRIRFTPKVGNPRDFIPITVP